jgi:NADPH:quinone reductase
MIAIQIEHPGGPDVLKAVEVPDPVPQSGEVLIRVAAAGVARADTLQRRGRYPVPPGASPIPGLDVAGTIEVVGPGVSSFRPGERVVAILAGGGYAELCTAPVQQVLATPENWTDTEAATLPENLFTAFDNLVFRAELKAGETVLIHGGASGVGSMAIMLARLLGAVPYTTAGSPGKCAACRELGAEAAIDYRTSDFVADLSEFTDGRGVDVILDMIGGSYLARNLEALSVEGRVAIIATQGGSSAELDIALLMRKRLKVMGSMMRARTPDEKGVVTNALRERIWPHLPGKQSIRPVIDSTYPLHEAWRAHQRMESGEHIGKILLVNRPGEQS